MDPNDASRDDALGEMKENIANLQHQHKWISRKNKGTNPSRDTPVRSPLCQYAEVKPSSMSPVSSLSHNFSNMVFPVHHLQQQLQVQQQSPQQPQIQQPQPPSQPYNNELLLSPTYVPTQVQRVATTSSVRRKLSLSMEPIPSRVMDDQTNDKRLSPAKKSNSFGSAGSPKEKDCTDSIGRAETVSTGRGSPYKTPSKRGIASIREEEGEESCGGKRYDDGDDETTTTTTSTSTTSSPASRLTARSYLRASCDSSMLSAKKKLYKANIGTIDTSFAPLRRSTSVFQLKKGLPKPDFSPTDSQQLPSPRSFPQYFIENQESKAFILPTMIGQHPDLNCISPTTVVALMNGEYNHIFSEYFIIDCRYPYEYEGGHIKGALNLTEQQVQEKFITNPITNHKVCLIFHCEFSSKRAPQSYRALRELDRKVNYAHYPKLYYPEIYYIDGGYKKFYETHQDYCNGTYVEMRDEGYSAQYKQINKIRRLTRSKSLDNLSSQFAVYQAYQHQPSKLKPRAIPDLSLDGGDNDPPADD